MEAPAIIPQVVLDIAEDLRARGVAIAESRIGSAEWDQLNLFDQVLAELPQCGEKGGGDPFKYTHLFTPVPGISPDGKPLRLYVRTITMPGPHIDGEGNQRTGALLTSGIHLFEHPFVVTRGICSVWSFENGWETFYAGHIGITPPGTRRLLYIHKETTWSTFHVTDKTDPDEVVREITYDHKKLGHLSEIPAERNQQKAIA